MDCGLGFLELNNHFEALCYPDPFPLPVAETATQTDINDKGNLLVGVTEKFGGVCRHDWIQELKQQISLPPIPFPQCGFHSEIDPSTAWSPVSPG